MIVSEASTRYVRSLTDEPEAFSDMRKHAVRDEVPVVVRETGALLHVLALACAANRIIEVGTAIGVSTLHLASALPAGGKLVSFDIDKGRQRAARDYLERAGLLDRVELRLEDARDGLPSVEGLFDMAFIDGPRSHYDDYFDALMPVLRPGAVLTVDNVLMSGTVAEGRSDGIWNDELISKMRAFNRRLVSHEQLTGTVTTVGDGVLIAVKR
jgi:predicted O-methyltransferase YrrM